MQEKGKAYRKMKYLAESEFCFLPGFFNFQNQHHTLESGLQFGVWLPIKSEQLLFLFPQKYGKLAWIHLKLRLAYYCNPVVNGDPQKAAQMICATDGSVHRMEEQKNMYLDIPRGLGEILHFYLIMIYSFISKRHCCLIPGYFW